MLAQTQGPIANRTTEHLSFPDRGVVVYRRLLKKNIGRVQQDAGPPTSMTRVESRAGSVS